MQWYAFTYFTLNFKNVCLKNEHKNKTQNLHKTKYKTQTKHTYKAKHKHKTTKTQKKSQIPATSQHSVNTIVKNTKQQNRYKTQDNKYKQKTNTNHKQNTKPYTQ